MITDNVIDHIQLRLYLEYVHPIYGTTIPPIRLQRYYSSYYCTALHCTGILVSKQNTATTAELLPTNSVAGRLRGRIFLGDGDGDGGVVHRGHGSAGIPPPIPARGPAAALEGRQPANWRAIGSTTDTVGPSASHLP